MFRKSRPPPPSHLAERVRQVATPRVQEGLPPLKRQSKPDRKPRAMVFRQATLVFDDGQKFPVVVKDVSEDGARVEFFMRTALPDRILLIEPTLRLRKRALVVWQRDGAAGLRFLD